MIQLFKKFYRKLFRRSKINDEVPPFIKLGYECYLPKNLIVAAGKDGKLVLEGNNYIGQNVEIFALHEVSLGENASIQHRCTIDGDVEIGANCLFAPNVLVSSGRHNFEMLPELCIKDQDIYVINNLYEQYSDKVVIGEDCWIGTNVVIMPGVTIGKGVVVGSNSVVKKDIPPYTVYGGNPARLLKDRLEFKPPAHLLFDDNLFLPYFYKGFNLRLKDLEIDRPNGGISCKKKFVFALDNSNGKGTLSIKCKKSLEDRIFLKYEDQTLCIDTNDWVTIEFNVNKKGTNYFEFEIEPKLDLKRILLINHVQLL